MCAIGNSIHSQNCQECARFNMLAMSPVRTPAYPTPSPLEAPCFLCQTFAH
jgi:hypothetical protein